MVLVQSVKNTFSLPPPNIPERKTPKEHRILRIVKSIFKKIAHYFQLLFSSRYRIECRTFVQKKKENAVILIQKTVRGHLAREQAARFRAAKRELEQTAAEHERCKEVAAASKEQYGLDQLALQKLEKQIVELAAEMGTIDARKHLLLSYGILQNRLSESQTKTDRGKKILVMFNPKYKQEFSSEQKLQEQIEAQLHNCEGEIRQLFLHLQLDPGTIQNVISEMERQIEELRSRKAYCEESYQAALDQNMELEKAFNEAEEKWKRAQAAYFSALETVNLSGESRISTAKKPEIKAAQIHAPSIKKEPEAADKPINAQGTAITAIGNYLGEEMGALFSTLFSRFPEGTILSWTCDADRRFELILTEQIRLWMPSENDQRVKGGVVMEFGDDSNSIQGSFDEQSRTVLFESGIRNICYVKIMGFSKGFTPKLKKITFKGAEQIEFSVQLGRFPEETSINNFDSLIDEWGRRSEHVASNPWEFIKSKW